MSRCKSVRDKNEALHKTAWNFRSLGAMWHGEDIHEHCEDIHEHCEVIDEHFEVLDASLTLVLEASSYSCALVMHGLLRWEAKMSPCQSRYWGHHLLLSILPSVLLTIPCSDTLARTCQLPKLGATRLDYQHVPWFKPSCFWTGPPWITSGCY